MSSLQAAVGKAGESRAAEWIQEKGYRVLARNFRTRAGELDLIAEKDGTIVFFEIKTRAHISPEEALEAITLAKQKHLASAALSYLKRTRQAERTTRFDVLVLLPEKTVWVPGAFEAPDGWGI